VAAGQDELKGCIFIAGAFNNYPSVILYEENAEQGPVVTAIGPNGELYGLVTSVTQVMWF